MADIDRIIEKVKKCLALSKSSNEHEAAAALRQAQKLMEAYNLTAEAIGQAEVGEESAECPSAWVKPPQWEINLIMLLGRAFGCKVLLQRGRPGVLARFSMIGLTHQAKLAVYSYDVLRRQAANARAKYVAGLPEYLKRGEKIQAGEAFCIGFMDRVRKQVSELAMTDEQRAAIEERFKARATGEPYKAPKRLLPQGAYEAGAQAGADAYLNRPVDGATKLAALTHEKGPR